jgi:putative transposase
MSRYRLVPTPAQEAVLRSHCAHARYVWNLAVEQHAYWQPGRKSAPGYLEQCRQLTAARAEHAWLRAGSQMVQQQALRDFALAIATFFDLGNLAGRPTWRKAGRNEGFRIVGRRGRQWNVRRLSRKVGEVWVPKAGWVRFRWSRAVPVGVKSYRVTRDRAGRWHVAFAAIPAPVPAPGNGEAVGIDRGVAVSAALSTGDLLHAPGLTGHERRRLRRLQRRLARARRGSNRSAQVKLAVARLRGREIDRRKDWAEKVSTDIARRFDLIRAEDLKISAMTRSARGTAAVPGRNVRQKAGLNRGILASGWGLLVRRLEQKAPGRVEKINPAFTSQRCSACGQVDRKSRESQAVFRCTACGFACNADVNAARNIAAGHAVTARGGDGVTRPVNREPQLLASLTGEQLESSPSGREDAKMCSRPLCGASHSSPACPGVGSLAEPRRGREQRRDT